MQNFKKISSGDIPKSQAAGEGQGRDIKDKEKEVLHFGT